MRYSEIADSASIQSVLEGRSFIDAKRLNITSSADAEEFIACYGFDIHDESDRLEINQIYKDALALIHEDLLNEGESIPLHFIEHQDIVQMLCDVSSQESTERSMWSCSILRVMHTLAHSYSFLNDRFQAEIREQILARFSSHIATKDGTTYLGDIPLASFDCRPAKSKRSVALKLLHKAENVAADIFDWVGIRFIAETRFDAFKVLLYLRQKNRVMFANVKPSRCRNSLIDYKWVCEQLDQGIEEKNIIQMMEAMPYPDEAVARLDNPYTEVSYHSIQFTARQRISITTDAGQKRSFFFPFEIQIMDQASYQLTRIGLASHDLYKKRQKRAIRKRILPQLIKPSS